MYQPKLFQPVSPLTVIAAGRYKTENKLCVVDPEYVYAWQMDVGTGVSVPVRWIMVVVRRPFLSMGRGAQAPPRAFSAQVAKLGRVHSVCQVQSWHYSSYWDFGDAD